MRVQFQLMRTYNPAQQVNSMHSSLQYPAIFYYTLGNISPKYRPSLRCIQLLSIVKSTVLQEYGADVILESLMEDLRELEKVGDSC